MKIYIVLSVCLLFLMPSYAQVEGCDGSRYFDDIFNGVKVTKGLKYGEGETLFGTFQELYLDVYEPEGDQVAKRPVIILAFGGSFISGEREDLEFLCEAYARKGYVAVTIDYRLYDGPFFPPPTDVQMQNIVIRTVSDMKAAIRYMRQDADTDDIYRIDPDQIFVGGISAGSITAFHTGVIDESDSFTDELLDILEENGGFEGNSSDNFQYSSEVQGIINFSGGLNNASWIDANDPPIVSIHDDMDGIVPYGEGFASVFGFPIIYMEGSKTCHEVADSVGIDNKLRSIENSNGHVSYFFSGNDQDVISSINFSSNFVGDIICETISNTAEISSDLESIVVYPNPTNGLLSISNISDLDLNIELIDIYGRSLEIYSNNKTLDLSGYSSGIYFVKMTDVNSKDIRVMKLILEK